jgi:hypothetical protein
MGVAAPIYAGHNSRSSRMATLPRAVTTVQDTATAKAAGQDLICILAPVPTSADLTPRQFGSASAIYAQHGYSEGLEYAALHIENTGLPVLFVPLPISTVGVVGRVATNGNTGTSVVSVAAGVSGVLGEHEGRVKVVTGGTVGTDQIILDVSADDGKSYKRVRLGTATSYVVPYLGVTLSFAAGTLVAGDTVITWFGAGPRAASADITTARTTLAGMLKFFRSMLLCGDVQNSTEALAFNTELDAYASSNDRFIYGRASIKDRAPLARMSQTRVRMTGSPTLTFAEVGATADTITRSSGSWITDGFAVNDLITVTGAVNGANNETAARIVSLTATVLTLDTEDLDAEVGTAGCTVVASPRLTFAEVGATGDTITRSRGSWLDDGFRVGDIISVTGTASNNITGASAITAVTATVLTLGSDDLAAEVIASYGVTVVAGQTKAAWMAASDAAFAAVDAKKRIDLSAGRARIKSPFSDYWYRRPAAWDASVREYQHDLHVATWRKSDGPVLGDLFDSNGTLVEWDDRVDGGAGSAARFTTYRTWANGPAGAFIAKSLTREVDASLLSETHNVAVVNAVCSTVQLNAELAIGQSLILNADGTATEDSLTTIEDRVNSALRSEVLEDKRGEGPRASLAVWTASRSDILNVPGAVLNAVCRLNLNGTIQDVNTPVRVLSGGQA